MQPRSLTLFVLLAAVGCATTTAHRLPIANNPLGAAAAACELRCRRVLLPPAPVCAPRTDFELGGRCDLSDGFVDHAPYAACLDGCPGATAIDGGDCPDPPPTGVVCVRTTKANTGAIVGGALAAAAIVVALVLVSAMASLFTSEQRGLGLSGGR